LNEENESLYLAYTECVNEMFVCYVKFYANRYGSKILLKSEHERILKDYQENNYRQVYLALSNICRKTGINDNLKMLIDKTGLAYDDWELSVLKNAMENLTDTDKLLIKNCLRACVEGPFFPDWEFSTLFGLTRDEVNSIYIKFPDINEKKSDTSLAINNAFNMLLFYPHEKNDILEKYIHISRNELSEKYTNWRILTNRKTSLGKNASEDMFNNLE
jgi:hypothetical protein